MILFKDSMVLDVIEGLISAGRDFATCATCCSAFEPFPRLGSRRQEMAG